MIGGSMVDVVEKPEEDDWFDLDEQVDPFEEFDEDPEEDEPDLEDEE